MNRFKRDWVPSRDKAEFTDTFFFKRKDRYETE